MNWQSRIALLAALLLGGVLWLSEFSIAQTTPAVVSTPVSYDTLEQRDVMITMRDGVRLATNVFLPAKNGVVASGRFPAIVERTPYDKNSFAPIQLLVPYFVSRGYAVVSQDVRGRYGSEGHWRPLREDGLDGFDLLKWIGEQPWSNGKVGTVGTSYAGGTQHALAIANAPNLAAMVPVDAMKSSPVR